MLRSLSALDLVKIRMTSRITGTLVAPDHHLSGRNLHPAAMAAAPPKALWQIGLNGLPSSLVKAAPADPFDGLVESQMRLKMVAEVADGQSHTPERGTRM